MLMILARLVRSESFWAVVKIRSPHTGPEPGYPRQGGATVSGTVPTGRGSRDDSRESTAGIRGVGIAFEKSGMALPATLSLTRAHHRDCGGRAAVARLPPS